MTEIPHPESVADQSSSRGEDIFERMVHESAMRGGTMGAEAISAKDTIEEGIVQESVFLFGGKIIATRGEIDAARREQR